MSKWLKTKLSGKQMLIFGFILHATGFFLAFEAMLVTMEEIPNAKFAKELDQIEKEEKSGDMRNYVKFANMDEAIAYMKEYVKKSNRRRRAKKSISTKTRRR